MPRLPPTIDAGSHSDFCCHLLTTRHRAHLRSSEAPISSRTRSHTAPLRASLLSSTASHIRATKRGPKMPERGTHVRKALSKRDQRSAANQLCRTRLHLKRYLESSQEFTNRDGRMHHATRLQIQQLSRVSRTGALGPIPAPVSSKTKSAERIEAERARRRARPSPLASVERYLTEQEMDDEFGLLPGEERDDGEDLDAEMAVMAYATVDGRALEALCDGEAADGIWKDVSVQLGDALETAARWAMRRDYWHMRAREGAVMDGRCVGVVEGVWGRLAVI